MSDEGNIQDPSVSPSSILSHDLKNPAADRKELFDKILEKVDLYEEWQQGFQPGLGSVKEDAKQVRGNLLDLRTDGKLNNHIIADNRTEKDNVYGGAADLNVPTTEIFAPTTEIFAPTTEMTLDRLADELKAFYDGKTEGISERALAQGLDELRYLQTEHGKDSDIVNEFATVLVMTNSFSEERIADLLRTQGKEEGPSLPPQPGEQRPQEGMSR